MRVSATSHSLASLRQDIAAINPLFGGPHLEPNPDPLDMKWAFRVNKIPHEWPIDSASATRHYSAQHCRNSAMNCPGQAIRSEEHTSELQSHVNLVCRLLLEKKK